MNISGMANTVVNMKCFYRFFSIGIINTLVSYNLFLWINYVTTTPVFASAISFLFGLSLSYVLNVRFTFKKQTNSRSFFLFLIVNLCLLFYTMIAISFLVSQCGIPAYLAQIMIVIIRFPFSYILSMKVIHYNEQ
jgi:putative flippase GtrA